MHYMKLLQEPFLRIQSGEKTIEFRLNDEKRQLVKIGDYITFKNIQTEEELVCECVALHRADTFLKLFEILCADMKVSCGDGISPQNLAQNMRKYYSLEAEQQYGVLGIELEVLK